MIKYKIRQQRGLLADFVLRIMRIANIMLFVDVF